MYTRVRELRKQKNISQMALAVRIGCSQNAISKIEKGECIPRAEWLVELSRYFGVSIDYILGLTDYRYNMETNNRYTNMSTPTREYLDKFEKLNKEEQQAIQSVMDCMIETKEPKA